MEILRTLWYLFLFLLSIIVYLSFSVIAQDVLASITLPLERKKEEGYKLPPFSVLFDTEERLFVILQFCRLVFAVPVIVLTFYWGNQVHFAVGIALLVLIIPLLHVLPEWLAFRPSHGTYRTIVQALSYLLYPTLWVLERFSPSASQKVETQNEAVKTNGKIEEAESQEFKGEVIKAVSTMGETIVREVMTPRVDMVTISGSASIEELGQFFREHKFSRVPVYRERVDNIVGIVGVMDFVSRNADQEKTATVENLMRPAQFVPETKRVVTLLREFRETHVQMAVVIDEYGGTSGLVTLEDLLEEIVGEISDEFDEAPDEGYRERDGAYVVTGKYPVERLEELFGIQVSAEDFETISGLIFSIVGRIPQVGEIVKYQNLNMEILEADKRRIHRVRIRQLKEQEV
jgi:CBS domain containing-hemolysin-like protein